jgi:hypothetical protein
LLLLLRFMRGHYLGNKIKIQNSKYGCYWIHNFQSTTKPKTCDSGWCPSVIHYMHIYNYFINTKIKMYILNLKRKHSAN